MDEEDVIGVLSSGGAILFDCVNKPGIAKDSKYYYDCQMNMDTNEVKFENNYAYTSGGAIKISGEYNNVKNRGVKHLLKDQIYINNTA